MSLINEALRKARQDAAEQDANERGVAYRPPRAHLPTQSRLGVGLVLGIAAGFAVAFLAAWWLLRPSPADPVAGGPGLEVADHAPSPAPDAGITSKLEPPEPLPAQPVAPSASPDSDQRKDPRAGARPARSAQEPSAAAPRSASSNPEKSSATQAVEPPTPPLGPIRAPVADQEVSASVATTLAPAEAPGAQTGGAVPAKTTDLPKLIEPPASVGRVSSDEFVLEATLGDLVLSLDFIVWSATKPFAQINGRQVEVGQQVEGLLVESIERDRVGLRGTNGSIVLRIR